MSLKYSAGLFITALMVIVPAWAGDGVEIYHDIDKPAKQKIFSVH